MLQRPMAPSGILLHHLPLTTTTHAHTHAHTLPNRALPDPHSSAWQKTLFVLSQIVCVCVYVCVCMCVCTTVSDCMYALLSQIVCMHYCQLLPNQHSSSSPHWQ